MSKIKVGVFFGGKSAEYSVSLQSASSILRSIDKNKYEPIMIGISERGNFYHYTGSIKNIENDTWLKEAKPLSLDLAYNSKPSFFVDKGPLTFDIAFPVLHGTNGEDGRIQGLFELLGIKTVGCNMGSSSLAMDKYRSKIVVEASGINIPKSLLFKSNDSLEEMHASLSQLTFPLYIKPLKAGSSYGITKIFDISEFQDAFNFAITYDDYVIIEENIDGFEVGCAIMGNDELIIGDVDEIELHTDFFNFEEKYTLKTSTIHLPARVNDSLKKEIKEVALNIYRILGCKGCARVDLFISDHKIYFNEVNTMPGFTSHSRFPNMLKESGYEFSEIIDKLIQYGLDYE